MCNDTGLPYCEYSCAVDNGGCDEGRRCVEVDVPSCGADQCCSHVNITCQGKLLSEHLHAYIRIPTHLAKILKSKHIVMYNYVYVYVYVYV